MTPVSNECATEGCNNAGTERFEAGGVGSQYCTDCRAKITALHSYDKQAMEGAAEFFESMATMGNPAPLAFAQAIRRALRSHAPEPSPQRMRVRETAEAIAAALDEQMYHTARALALHLSALSPTVSQPVTGEEVVGKFLPQKSAIDALNDAFYADDDGPNEEVEAKGRVLGGEPAAWQRYNERLGWTPVDAEYAKVLVEGGEQVRPLYTAPPDYQALKAQLDEVLTDFATTAFELRDTQARLSAVEGALEKAVEALKPFAEAGEVFAREYPAMLDKPATSCGIRFDALNAAREALTTITGGENER